MRLSGVDPGIIRELSGIYKPFVKAFKELISNAYDADAKAITVTLSSDWKTINIADDGNGMTPYQFYRDFARLGGSTAWQLGGKSHGGRERIGYKGIGFLAVARYCKKLRVRTQAVLPYRGEETVLRGNRKNIPLTDLVGDLVPSEQLAGKITVHEIRLPRGSSFVSLVESKDYRVAGDTLRLLSERALDAKSFIITFDVDCRHISVDAALDFDYLLGLDHRADLSRLDDFCHMNLTFGEPAKRGSTTVTLEGLREFVIRELSAPALKGKARNVASKSGQEQFLWRVARCSPIRDDIPQALRCSPLRALAAEQAAADLPTVNVKWRDEPPVQLKRQVYLPKDDDKSPDETVFPIHIDEDGLRATGYLLARSEIIYPAELRGISIRVRNVAIGDVSFLGWESIMSGPRKAALSQITGEIVVERGIDAADAINPGRESFYEENDDFRILKRKLFGSEESVGGVVGKAIASIMDRIHVRSQVTERLTEAKQRRKTLIDISSAVNHFSQTDVPAAQGLTDFFDGKTTANGLSEAKDFVLRPRHKLGGFEIEVVNDLATDYEIDFKTKKVLLNFKQSTWDQTVYLNGHYYEVSYKNGRADHPVCEFDNDKRRIYVNWAHPVKLQMDDIGFLRSAIILRLAYHASPSNANSMLELALNMLAFRSE